MSRRAGDGALDENDDGESGSDTASQSSMPIMFPHHNTDLTRKQVLKPRHNPLALQLFDIPVLKYTLQFTVPHFCPSRSTNWQEPLA